MGLLAEKVDTLFSTIQGLGSIIFVPVVILIIGLLFGVGLMKSFKSAVSVGVGFVGVNLVLNIVWQNICPITDKIVSTFNLRMDVIDASWPASAAVGFSSQIGAFIIPIILAVNYIMLKLKLTNTLNIDIWNYWHYAIAGALISAITGSMFYGFVTAACSAIICLKFADICASTVQKELDIPNVAVPHGISCSLVPVYLILDKIYDKIPFLKHRGTENKIASNKYLRFFSEPLVIGFIIGIAIGTIAGAESQATVELGIYMSALMILLPKIVKIIMEGLIPISHAVRKIMIPKVNNVELNIGLDSAVTLGHPTTSAVAMLLIPITIILAFLFPGNRTVPIGDLGSIAFFIALATPIHKGNFWRTTFSGIITMSILLCVSSQFAPYYTALAHYAGGLNIPQGLTMITALSIGNPITWIFVKLFEVKFIGLFLVLSATALVILLCILFEKRLHASQIK